MEYQVGNAPKVGEQYELSFKVQKEHTVEFQEKGIPPILSTPSLIWFMEFAAYELLDQYLNSEELSVGIHVDVEHLAITPINQNVTCKAKVIHQEKQTVNFQVEAFDEKELIGKGVHKRQIVKVNRFHQAIEKKCS